MRKNKGDVIMHVKYSFGVLAIELTFWTIFKLPNIEPLKCFTDLVLAEIGPNWSTFEVNSPFFC